MSNSELTVETLENPLGLTPRTSALGNSVLFGTICGLISAIGYSGANVCLRAVAHCDPVWVSAVKAFPTVVLVIPWLILRAHRGQRVWPPLRVCGSLIVAGLIGQLAGNVMFQWSLGIVGMALAVPLCLGGQIISSALLGRMILGEGITWRLLIAILFLVSAVCVLSWGAGAASQSMGIHSRLDGWLVASGVAAVCSSGLAYSILGLVIRRSVQQDAALSTTLFLVCLVGLIALGLLSYQRIGLEGMLSTSSTDLGVIVLAGVCNAVAFLCLTKALQLTGLLYVNLLGATQAMLAAVAGVMFFGESRSTSLLVGVALTIVGLLVLSKKSEGPAARAVDADQKTRHTPFPGDPEKIDDC